jgi:hypothetical protein
MKPLALGTAVPQDRWNSTAEVSPLPFSWLRIPSNTSNKLKNCVAGDPSKVKFANCLQRIVEEDGGTVDQVLFEVNGKWAHAHVKYDSDDQLRHIVFDTGADSNVELLTAEQIDELQNDRNVN